MPNRDRLHEAHKARVDAARAWRLVREILDEDARLRLIRFAKLREAEAITMERGALDLIDTQGSVRISGDRSVP